MTIRSKYFIHLHKILYLVDQTHISNTISLDSCKPCDVESSLVVDIAFNKQGTRYLKSLSMCMMSMNQNTIFLLNIKINEKSTNKILKDKSRVWLRMTRFGYDS